MQVLIDGGNNGFYIMPKGQEINPDLSKYVHETQAENIEVTEEEYQIYCEMGSSFQLCKVGFGKKMEFLFDLIFLDMLRK